MIATVLLFIVTGAFFGAGLAAMQGAGLGVIALAYVLGGWAGFAAAMLGVFLVVRRGAAVV